MRRLQAPVGNSMDQAQHCWPREIGIGLHELGIRQSFLAGAHAAALLSNERLEWQQETVHLRQRLVEWGRERAAKYPGGEKTIEKLPKRHWKEKLKWRWPLTPLAAACIQDSLASSSASDSGSDSYSRGSDNGLQPQPQPVRGRSTPEGPPASTTGKASQSGVMRRLHSPGKAMFKLLSVLSMAGGRSHSWHATMPATGLEVGACTRCNSGRTTSYARIAWSHIQEVCSELMPMLMPSAWQGLLS